MLAVLLPVVNSAHPDRNSCYGNLWVRMCNTNQIKVHAASKIKITNRDFSGSLVVKASPSNAGVVGSISVLQQIQ